MKNSGKGFCIKEWIEFYQKNYLSIDIILFADADSQYTYTDIQKIIEYCEKNEIKKINYR